jgi:c-di-GMP-binding flagellar brake protein YcgR
MDALDAILKANDLVAVLGREVSVRLLDISASGCLLESASRLVLGTTGSLLVSFEAKDYVDDVRIMRCRECEGSNGAYQIGAEFLWTNTPHEHSLRRIVTRLQASAIKSGSFGQSIRM